MYAPLAGPMLNAAFLLPFVQNGIPPLNPLVPLLMSWLPVALTTRRCYVFFSAHAITFLLHVLHFPSRRRKVAKQKRGLIH